MEAVARKANKTAGEHAKIVIVSPIHLGKGVGEEGFDPEFNESSENVSRQLAWEYEKIAKENGFIILMPLMLQNQVKLTDSI